MTILNIKQGLHIEYIRQILRWGTQRRHLFRWLKSLQKDYLLSSPSPWMSFDAIDYLKNYLKNISGAHLFEYGSGGSTLFWLTQGAKVVSIEHDPLWYALVNKYTGQTEDLDYRLIEPEFRGRDWEKTSDAANPDDYATADEKLRNYSFRQYVRQIDSFPDNYFDIIIIDGRSRPACIKHSVSKVAPGGVVVLDNADRSYYLEIAYMYLSDFFSYSCIGVTPVVDFPSNTTIYKKNDK